MENITPILEHLFGTSEIKTKEDLQMLVDALRSMPEDTEINTESMAEIMSKLKKK